MGYGDKVPSSRFTPCPCLFSKPDALVLYGGAKVAFTTQFRNGGEA
jgi:hypothetical protein